MPEGAADALAAVIDALEPGARVLDCAAGTGQLAVGLALRGFDAVASDAGDTMVKRTRWLAEQHGARIEAYAQRWDELDAEPDFDAVFCVGNALTHAEGRAARRTALAAMAGALHPGGVLAVTSRNWEHVRAAGSRLEVADRLVERDGRKGLVVYGWTISEDPGEPHDLDVAVALLGEPAEVRALRIWAGEVDTCERDEREGRDRERCVIGVSVAGAPLRFAAAGRHS